MKYEIEYRNTVLNMGYKEIVNEKAFAEELVFRTNKVSKLTDTIAKIKEYYETTANME